MAGKKIEIYVNDVQKLKIERALDNLGVKKGEKSRLFVSAIVHFLIKHRDLSKKHIKELRSIKGERQAKLYETDTGDLFGSVEKRKEKLKDAKRAYRRSIFGKVGSKKAKELLRMAIDDINRNYDLTTKAKIKRLKQRDKLVKKRKQDDLND